MRTKTPNAIRIAQDPHHDQNYWCFDGYDFWILTGWTTTKWTKAKKSHITAKRAVMFNYLVTGIGESNIPNRVQDTFIERGTYGKVPRLN